MQDLDVQDLDAWEHCNPIYAHLVMHCDMPGYGFTRVNMALPSWRAPCCACSDPRRGNAFRRQTAAEGMDVRSGVRHAKAIKSRHSLKPTRTTLSARRCSLHSSVWACY